MIEKIGHIDKNYKIEWEELENMVLCTAYGKLKKISTKIHKVIKLD
jgi:DNA mismatch repair protein MutH